MCMDIVCASGSNSSLPYEQMSEGSEKRWAHWHIQRSPSRAGSTAATPPYVEIQLRDSEFRANKVVTWHLISQLKQVLNVGCPIRQLKKSQICIYMKLIYILAPERVRKLSWARETSIRHCHENVLVLKVFAWALENSKNLFSSLVIFNVMPFQNQFTELYLVISANVWLFNDVKHIILDTVRFSVMLWSDDANPAWYWHKYYSQFPTSGVSMNIKNDARVL